MITIIAAVAANRVIGNRNDLPWYLPEDLKRFKELTSGHPVIMGRKTFESILARLHKPLPGRTHFVLTSNPSNLELPSDWSEEYKNQIKAFASLEEAVSAAQALDSQVFIIGGEKVFADSLPMAEKLELTELKKEYEGDAYFPEFDKSQWNKTQVEHDEYYFATYTRK